MSPSLILALIVIVLTLSIVIAFIWFCLTAECEECTIFAIFIAMFGLLIFGIIYDSKSFTLKNLNYYRKQKIKYEKMIEKSETEEEKKYYRDIKLVEAENCYKTFYDKLFENEENNEAEK